MIVTCIRYSFDTYTGIRSPSNFCLAGRCEQLFRDMHIIPIHALVRMLNWFRLIYLKSELLN